MNRKEFIITGWKKIIIPILVIGIIFFCIQFIYNVFITSGTERFLTVLVIGFGLLMLIAYLIGNLFKSLSEKINAILPEPVKLWLRIINKFLNYLSPIIFKEFIEILNITPYIT